MKKKKGSISNPRFSRAKYFKKKNLIKKTFAKPELVLQLRNKQQQVSIEQLTQFHQIHHLYHYYPCFFSHFLYMQMVMLY
jgi:hypothetical protein